MAKRVNIDYYVYKCNHCSQFEPFKVGKVIIMNIDAMTNQSIASEVGHRIEQMRLEQNLTQQQIADEIGLSRVSYRKLVNGSGKFENIIAALRALGQLDLVNQFVPKTTFSPMEQLRLKGKQRQRASGEHGRHTDHTQRTDKQKTELGW